MIIFSGNLHAFFNPVLSKDSYDCRAAATHVFFSKYTCYN
ncbi:hypothetical protein HMPREF0083_02442 [Aneurinibacillus aneurinilyticus ATCC 12856]|uniref:Uncharacterized protein n=1 Tax=Aneurinibacillus aneurinilyticus ATCC 12856 TaxID=649747 RepID=U1X3B2_ANEAE|nr:hypothetical protein HMPREF0083_02442 [Aneurinibacillus aneurinilyticus ATCC 12856]